LLLESLVLGCVFCLAVFDFLCASLNLTSTLHLKLGWFAWMCVLVGIFGCAGVLEDGRLGLVAFGTLLLWYVSVGMNGLWIEHPSFTYEMGCFDVRCFGDVMMRMLFEV
jgi:hypothetical protein